MRIPQPKQVGLEKLSKPDAITSKQDTICSYVVYSWKQESKDIQEIHHLLLSPMRPRTIRFPLRRPTLPSPTRAFHLLPTVSLSLPIFRAVSFQSRFESLSLSSTSSTSLLSSSLVHSEPVFMADGPCASSLLTGLLSREFAMRRLLLRQDVDCDFCGVSSDLKSDASRPNGTSSGARRRRLGVEKPSRSPVAISGSLSSS